jgi:hypothetical protein
VGDVRDAFRDAHLPDVEDAFTDLCDHEILTRLDSPGCYGRGPKWAEIESYSMRCDPTSA